MEAACPNHISIYQGKSSLWTKYHFPSIEAQCGGHFDGLFQGNTSHGDTQGWFRFDSWLNKQLILGPNVGLGKAKLQLHLLFCLSENAWGPGRYPQAWGRLDRGARLRHEDRLHAFISLLAHRGACLLG